MCQKQDEPQLRGILCPLNPCLGFEACPNTGKNYMPQLTISNFVCCWRHFWTDAVRGTVYASMAGRGYKMCLIFMYVHVDVTYEIMLLSFHQFSRCFSSSGSRTNEISFSILATSVSLVRFFSCEDMQTTWLCITIDSEETRGWQQVKSCN